MDRLELRLQDHINVPELQFLLCKMGAREEISLHGPDGRPRKVKAETLPGNSSAHSKASQEGRLRLFPLAQDTAPPLAQWLWPDAVTVISQPKPLAVQSLTQLSSFPSSLHLSNKSIASFDYRRILHSN